MMRALPEEMTMRKAFLAFACASAFSVPLVAATLAGVTLPDTVTVGSQTLVLNGMGLRTKLFIKVYVGGLYLEKKSGEATAIIQSDTAKRVVLHFIYGEVTRDQMVESFTDGFKANAPGAPRAQVDQFLGALETMKKGEQLTVTYVPGTGTTLAIRGQDKLTIPGLPFAQAVFSVWLGPKPPTSDLKNGMLARK
jgi:Chalcone isomerase-like